jgi:hypothetical protein
MLRGFVAEELLGSDANGLAWNAATGGPHLFLDHENRRATDNVLTF